MNDTQTVGIRYHARIAERLQAIVDDEPANITRAAKLFVDQIRTDRLIHIYGAGGHSYVGSEEFFFRAGGLANVSPMYELSLSLAGGGQKSTMLEREEHIGDKMIKAHHLGPEDLLVVTSAYGINACTIDAALEAKRRGCRVIGISSREFAENTPKGFVARHSSNLNLGDITDVLIDNHVPHGETILELDGYPQKVGGTCNILACYCINWLVAETIELCLKEGIDPPVWKSANTEGGDEHNSQYLKRFTPRVKAL